MKSDVFKELERLAGDNKAKFSYNGLSGKLKTAFDNRSFLAKIRNALLVYFVLIIIFKISTWIAGKYLSGEEFASFMAYFSFFLLILGGLFLSFYFPMKYSGNSKGKGITIKLPSITFKRKPQQTKSEKELQKMLQNERKNVIKASKEKESVSKKLKNSQSMCERLEIEKKELALKNRELERASAHGKKRDFSGLADVLLPKKEVVLAEKGGKEMPKIKITGHDRKLAKKYKKLPAQQHQRVELYRNIARNIQKSQPEISFTVAQVMEVLIELFRQAIDDDRKKVLKEVQDWVKEDDYTPLIKTEKGVSYYRIIK